MLRKLRLPVLNRNQYLWVMFLVYILILFSFAAIYYHLYLKNPHNFAFNSEILSAQIESFRPSAESKIANYCLALDLLRRLKTQMEDGIAPPRKTGKWYDFDNGVQFTTRDYEYIFLQHVYGGAFTGVAFSYELEVTDKDGHEISNIQLPSQNIVKFPQNIEDGKILTGQLIAIFEREVVEIKRRVNTLSGRTPEVWSFWDFLYFSTITQTTVGYGDVLPNSTFVRVFVMIQLIIGTTVLVVVINLVFSKRTQERQGNLRGQTLKSDKE